MNCVPVPAAELYQAENPIQGLNCQFMLDSAARLRIPQQDRVAVTSGSLVLNGVPLERSLEETGDADWAVTMDGFADLVKNNDEFALYHHDNGDPYVSSRDGRVEASMRLPFGDSFWTVEELMDRSVVTPSGERAVPVGMTVRWRLKQGRRKDARDWDAISDYDEGAGRRPIEFWSKPESASVLVPAAGIVTQSGRITRVGDFSGVKNGRATRREQECLATMGSRAVLLSSCKAS